MIDEKIKCDICGKSFETKEQIAQHKQNTHVDKKNIKSSKSVKALIVIGMVAVIAGGVYWSQTSNNQPMVDDVRCDPTEFVDYHIHNECLFWLHTHNTSGVIHIEAPANKDFTLGQFFSVWGQTFSNTQIFDKMTSDKETLHVYVNGKEVNGDLRNIKINAHDEIAIVYGTSPIIIPSIYDFGGL
ncbi:MAG: hypothetical protein E6L05_01050 [Thaumarchaeota archaeon]|nr:MAG: hypothetical protein E6L05_01050 [Nitrososphaerota archaeon]